MGFLNKFKKPKEEVVPVPKPKKKQKVPKVPEEPEILEDEEDDFEEDEDVDEIDVEDQRLGSHTKDDFDTALFNLVNKSSTDPKEMVFALEDMKFKILEALNADEEDEGN